MYVGTKEELRYITDLSLPDDFLDGVADHVAMELQVHVVQHVGSTEQHRGRVGHVLTDALLEGMPRALPTDERAGQRSGHRSGCVRSHPGLSQCHIQGDS